MSDSAYYIVEYQYEGGTWSALILASSHADAEARLAALGATGKVLGQLREIVDG